jgi:hypothetical protein
MLGVGTGKPTLLGFLPVREKVVLRGVPIESSEPLGLDIDKFRCFKLSDDLFFLIPIAAKGLPFLGDPGTRPDSLDMALLSAGVAGDAVAIVSAGLYRVGCGEGAARLFCWDTWANAGSLNAGSTLD